MDKVNDVIYNTEISIDYEREYERLSKIIVKQKEEILALKNACFGMATALMQENI